MATSRAQRISIWVIIITMSIGSLGTYFVVVLANNNQTPQQDQQAQLQKQLKEYQKQIAKQAKENAAASQPITGYKATPFSSKVSSLEETDLVVGQGQVVPKGAKVTVSYFGWTPDGKIFDSSRKNGKNHPLKKFALKKGSAIQGWIDGIVGMKVGGVRQITIPASQAYGAKGSPPLIKPNTPIRFIVKMEKIDT